MKDVKVRGCFSAIVSFILFVLWILAFILRLSSAEFLIESAEEVCSFHLCPFSPCLIHLSSVIFQLLGLETFSKFSIYHFLFFVFFFLHFKKKRKTKNITISSSFSCFLNNILFGFRYSSLCVLFASAVFQLDDIIFYLLIH